MAIEIVDFPIKNGGSFHCYVSSPEGIFLNFEQENAKLFNLYPATKAIFLLCELTYPLVMTNIAMV